MTEIEQMTLNMVAHISAGKALKKKEPTHALLLEILEAMKKSNGCDPESVRGALRSLTRSHRIVWGNTAHDIYFKIKTDATE